MKRKPKGKKISFIVNVGRGPEAQNILLALKQKARDANTTLLDYVLTACFHLCPGPLSAKPIPPVNRQTPKKLTAQEVKDTVSKMKEIDYSDLDEPLPNRIDTAEMPSGMPKQP